MTRPDAAGPSVRGQESREGRMRGPCPGVRRVRLGVCARAPASLPSPRAPGSVTAKALIPHGRPGSYPGVLAGVSPLHRSFGALQSPGRLSGKGLCLRHTASGDPGGGPALAPHPEAGARLLEREPGCWSLFVGLGLQTSRRQACEGANPRQPRLPAQRLLGGGGGSRH